MTEKKISLSENILISTEKLINRLEKTPLSLFMIFFLFTFIVTLRYTIETIFFEDLGYFNLLSLTHQILFFLFTFSFGTLIISHFSLIRPTKVWKTFIQGYILFLIPPLIDYFIFGRTKAYIYIFELSLKEFLYHFFTMALFYTQRDGNHIIGIMIVIFIAFICAALYTYIKTKKVSNAFKTFFWLYFSTFYIFCYGPVSLRMLFDNTEFILANWLYALTSSVMLLYMIFKEDSISVKTFFSLIKFPHHVSFILMVLAAVIFKTKSLGIDIDVVIMLKTIILMTSILFIIISGSLYDNIKDYDIEDENKNLLKKYLISPDKAKNLIVVLSFISIIHFMVVFFSSFHFSLLSILIYFCIFSLCFFYSTILKKILFSSVTLSLIHVFCFLLGLFIVNDATSFFEMQAAIILFISMVLGTSVKDIHDVEEDMSSGSLSLFLLFKKETAKKIVILFLFFSFMLPVSLINSLFAVKAFFICYVFAAIAFYVYENVSAVILAFFLEVCVFLYLL